MIGLKIKSDGIRTNFETEDGDKLNVRAAVITCRINDVVRAEVETYVNDIDIKAEGEILVIAMPSGRKFRLEPLEEKAEAAAEPAGGAA